MRANAIALLASFLAAPAWAQAPPPNDTPAPPQGRLPLAAMRHAQPRRAEVDARERARLDAREAERQKQQRATVDQLYDEIMRRSAPASGR